MPSDFGVPRIKSVPSNHLESREDLQNLGGFEIKSGRRGGSIWETAMGFLVLKDYRQTDMPYLVQNSGTD